MEMDILNKDFETRIERLASAFPYPATPNISQQSPSGLRGGIRRWRPGLTPAWAWVVVLLLMVCGSLMAVPTVRAAVIEFLQIGNIRIFLEEEIPSLEPIAPTSTRPLLPETETPAAFIPAPRTSTPEEDLIFTSVLDLAGEVTLPEARERAPFPILLPTYPSDVGIPDKVFYQRLEGGWGVFLVWMMSDQPDTVKMSLLLLGPGAFAGKGSPDRVLETSVNGTRAIWTEGAHLLVLETGIARRDLFQLFVSGNVLIWEVDGITYRLESELPMEEAIQMAESLE